MPTGRRTQALVSRVEGEIGRSGLAGAGRSWLGHRKRGVKQRVERALLVSRRGRGRAVRGAKPSRGGPGSTGVRVAWLLGAREAEVRVV